MKEKITIKEEYSMIILAGGKSIRMGKDKSYLTLNGKSFLDIQIDLGIQLGIQDIIVSGKHQIDRPVRVIQDNYPDRGPLAGLEACLRHAKYKNCIVVCTDMPLITRELLLELIQWREKTAAPVITCEHCGREESLIGIYDASLADALLEELHHGKGSVFAFLHKAGCVWINMDKYDSCFQNINRPEEYETLVLS